MVNIINSTSLHIRPVGKKIQHYLIQWRWLIISIISIGLATFEIIEHPDFRTDSTAYFFKELALYYGLIIIIAVMIEQVIQANKAKNQAINVLDVRHNLSMQLIAAKDWDEVVTRIIQYPSLILPVSATSLYIFDEDENSYINERNWIGENEHLTFSNASIPKDSCCEDDIRLISAEVHQIRTARILQPDEINRSCYHVQINYGQTPIALLYLLIREKNNLLDEQVELLKNTVDDIAIGLNAAKQRQLQHAAELTTAAMNERLEIARDLHDTLGQNLGYLHLKLDQMLTNSRDSTYHINISDLERLRELANESYELVRATLVILHHDSDHRISELFNAHLQIMSKHSGIPVSLEEEGLSRSLPPFFLKQLLFAFKESLRNIEKHSGASQTWVNLNWSDTQLTVRIRDNGQGFETNQEINTGHYGLKIIEERIVSLGGSVVINSSPGSGTQVTFSLPLTTIDNGSE